MAKKDEIDVALNPTPEGATYRETKKGGRTFTVTKDWGEGVVTVRNAQDDEEGRPVEWTTTSLKIVKTAERVRP